MNSKEFTRLSLNNGDNIWILDEKGEGWAGTFLGYNENNMKTFSFHNFSKGKSQIIEIEKIQRLDINKRV